MTLIFEQRTCGKSKPSTGTTTWKTCATREAGSATCGTCEAVRKVDLVKLLGRSSLVTFHKRVQATKCESELLVLEVRRSVRVCDARVPM